MPLSTQIERNGKDLSLRWGGFHVACMVLATCWDTGEGCLTVKGEPNNNPPTEDELGGAYPDTPYPVTPDTVWALVGYHVLAATALNSGRYVLKGEHRFIDATDGEILHLLPGDVLKAWR